MPEAAAAAREDLTDGEARSDSITCSTRTGVGGGVRRERRCGSKSEGAFLIGCPALEAARRPERQQRSGEGVDGLRKMQRS